MTVNDNAYADPKETNKGMAMQLCNYIRNLHSTKSVLYGYRYILCNLIYQYSIYNK